LRARQPRFIGEKAIVTINIFTIDTWVSPSTFLGGLADQVARQWILSDYQVFWSNSASFTVPSTRSAVTM
jgi:hypothetical protein